MKKPSNTKAGIRSEYQEQCLVFEWAEIAKKSHTALEYLEGHLDGIRLTIGNCVKAKKSGCLKKGRPDIHLPVPINNFASLYIELKAKTGKPSKEQIAYMEGLKACGNCVKICYGAHDAIATIIKYLRGELLSD